ncbi:RNA-binding protein [Candidatus Pacearchaeota archaeon CG_4_9_14_3_um_filter_31_7]|nr:MAG: RNA-binding protein [Candidatus Pacearchaeota archaeon CG10_big_fil_rev_8_21_14_0_10_31_59]PIZ81236.1 MAG: RNA-binding protein [Candidatus Pacearchaeota archaeon CG_4_10_14_0_2_um_filter_31_10]PJA70715.1 MAG: RNA-binding protein [Candidatus Pacearchaeota archaeon CG_4_9_14_3_um_filter_31_7]
MIDKCISCSKKIVNEGVKFKCPSCLKENICRCDACRKKAVQYKCKCGFIGP